MGRVNLIMYSANVLRLLKWMPFYRIAAIIMITMASTAITTNEKSVSFVTELSP